LEEWKAYFRICERIREEGKDKDDKFEKAKAAAKNGGWD